jgi:hypothetical protein
MDVPPPISILSPRFMDRFRIFIRSRHLAYRTEKTYCHWATRFLRHCGYKMIIWWMSTKY